MEAAIRTPKQLGNALVRARAQAGLNQRALAEAIGSYQSTISSAESGGPGVRVRTVFEILAALGLELVVRPRSQHS
ncbi:MAG: hipB [Rhodospirillales bacterium]|jgi:HTH-type transcriptional regulator/antitoxin HipB|nr:hipB [Rhodospirillales bacterium]